MEIRGNARVSTQPDCRQRFGSERLIFLFFLCVALQRKPAALNDLRAPSKTKDTLHPSGRAAQRAPGGESDLHPQLLRPPRSESTARDSCFCRKRTRGGKKMRRRLRCSRARDARRVGFGLALPVNAPPAFCSRAADLAARGAG